jgi:hypothetical protein
MTLISSPLLTHRSGNPSSCSNNTTPFAFLFLVLQIILILNDISSLVVQSACDKLSLGEIPGLCILTSLGVAAWIESKNDMSIQSFTVNDIPSSLRISSFV